MYQLYWGDLHSHCSISYGHGTAEQALLRAQQQLDFCSVTGHAFWPDMPTDRATYGEIIDYHNAGFATLAGNWERLLAMQERASFDSDPPWPPLGKGGNIMRDDGGFLAIPSYEWHSLKYGDHNVYTPEPGLTLTDAGDLPELRKAVAGFGGIAIPHHIGYAAGYRGINWDAYSEEVSPFVEIFSLHGCSLDDGSPYPMLHDMGPRDFGSTAEAGWRRGFRFGIVGGTDHHGAYPGSHGDGRMGVFAKSLSREDLWEAFLAKRVFAATGDRIDAKLLVNDAWIGESIQSDATRNLRVAVSAADAIDKVELFKNGRLFDLFVPSPTEAYSDEWKVNITWGWGRKDRLVDWEFELSMTDARITNIETCFSGQAVVAPKTPGEFGETPDDVDLPHQLFEQSETGCVWKSVTTGNPTMRHAGTQGLRLTVHGDLNAKVAIVVNGQRFEHPLGDLVDAGRSHYLRGWLSEAVRIGPATAIGDCIVEAERTDVPSKPVDRYQLRVAQRNGQWAWLTPIWVER